MAPSDAVWRAMIEAAPCALAVLQDQRLVLVNRSAEQTFGISDRKSVV